ncbi:MAG: dTMP kinase, partial [Bacteroidales bacterium]
MGFIVIEGLDGSGKSTQLKLVENFFIRQKFRSRFIHFPRTETPVWGELISSFLKGELGDMNQVNPYLIALLYAGDRADAAGMLRKWMDDEYVVIADRYLYSNIAFQCAKLTDEKEKIRLAKWIKYVEYDYNKIPVPDLNLYLDVPFHFTRKNLNNSRKGSDREYLDGASDIHEADIDFQEKVREVYLWQVKNNDDFEAIDCEDSSGNMMSPEEISDHIIDKIKSKLS